MTTTERNIRPLIIYHGDCADGFGAAWCFWNVFRDSADYFAGHYGKPAPDVFGRDVYILDFSYKRDAMETILEYAHTVTYIDHHVSAIMDLSGVDFSQYYCNIDNSGAALAWEFTKLMKWVHKDYPMPQLIAHIQDRDLWHFNLEGTRQITAALFSYDYDFEIWNELIKGEQKAIEKLYIAGVALERSHAKNLKTAVKLTTRMMCIGDDIVPVANLPFTMASDAGDLMNKDAYFSASYYDTEDSRKFSLRSDMGNPSSADVSVIASMYGGGGHKNAAGFIVPRSHPLALA